MCVCVYIYIYLSRNYFFCTPFVGVICIFLEMFVIKYPKIDLVLACLVFLFYKLLTKSCKRLAGLNYMSSVRLLF